MKVSKEEMLEYIGHSNLAYRCGLTGRQAQLCREAITELILNHERLKKSYIAVCKSFGIAALNENSGPGGETTAPSGETPEATRGGPITPSADASPGPSMSVEEALKRVQLWLSTITDGYADRVDAQALATLREATKPKVVSREALLRAISDNDALGYLRSVGIEVAK